MLSSEFIPATRPRYQEPSSYSAQHACEKQIMKTPKETVYIFHTSNSFKEVSSYQEEKKRF